MSRTACIAVAAATSVVMVGCGDYTEEDLTKDSTKLFEKYAKKYKSAAEAKDKQKCKDVDAEAKKDYDKIDEKVKKQNKKDEEKAKKNKDKVSGSMQFFFFQILKNLSQIWKYIFNCETKLWSSISLSQNGKDIEHEQTRIQKFNFNIRRHHDLPKRP